MELLESAQRRLSDLGEVSSQAMFGGVALLVDAVLVAIVRDQRLYVRHPGEPPSDADFMPFRGSRLRLHFCAEDRPDESDWPRYCRQALDEIRGLAAKMPARGRFRAYRID